MRLDSMTTVKHALNGRSSILPFVSFTIAGMDLDDFDLATLGGRVAHAVQASTYPIESIAARMGISKQAIYQWIDGRTKNIRNEHLFPFADITGFSPRWIATGDGPQRPPRYDDHRVRHILKVMEALPDYAIDGAVKEVDTIAELINQAQSAAAKKAS